jgi:hypothetical protein
MAAFGLVRPNSPASSANVGYESCSCASAARSGRRRRADGKGKPASDVRFIDSPADLERFCSGVKSGGARIAASIRPHLSEAGTSCRDALAFIDAPGSIRQ